MNTTSVHCIGLMGYPGAGKTYGATLLEDILNADNLAIGDVVRDRAQTELGDNADSDTIGDWVTEQLNEDPTAINQMGCRTNPRTRKQ